MKKLLFITTKNLDYIRNTQEIRLIEEDNGGIKPDIIGNYGKSYIKRLLSVYYKIITTDFGKYDEIFVGFAPQLVIPLFSGKFKRFRKRGGRLSIDFFISVYDTFVCDRKRFPKGSLPAGISRYVDKKSIAAADRIIVDTKAHGRYFCEEFGADSGKMQVLYLEADKKIYYPHRVDKPDEYKGKKVVLYFASVLPLQGVPVVLEAAGYLKDDEDIHFVIIGPVKDKVIQKNITCIDWLTQQELSDAIAYADVCLAGHFNADIEKASRTIPGKAYIYRAMEKPMILGDNQANRELFDDCMEGITFCKMGDPLSLAQAIKNIN